MAYYTVNPQKKAPGTRAINKTGYIDLQTTILGRIKKQNKLLTQPFLILKSFGFHISLQSITICYCHSFKSYKVQSWKAVYISRRCQIAENDNNRVNFWCRKSLGKLNNVPTSNKTDSFSILIYFMSKLNSFMKEIVPKRDL